MTRAITIAATIGVVSAALPADPPAAQTTSSSPRVVLAASTILDGKGAVIRNTRIVIEDSRIAALDPRVGPIDYDLRGLTVLPGWIDAHVHITWSFGRDGRNAGGGGATPDAVFVMKGGVVYKMAARGAQGEGSSAGSDPRPPKIR